MQELSEVVSELASTSNQRRILAKRSVASLFLRPQIRRLE
jgi:hypothetical protein